MSTEIAVRMDRKAEANHGRTRAVLALIAIVTLGGFLALQTARLSTNTRRVENLSSQVESLAAANSKLRSQNEHLQATLQDYQDRVRAYQEEIYKLRQLTNATSINQTLLKWATTASIIAPAVKAVTTRGPFWTTSVTYVGIPTNLTLEAVPGRGRVLVSTRPPMGEVFQDTAVTAKEAAERITGLSFGNYDLIFSIEADDTIPSVDGPSAGAAMAVLASCLLEQRRINPRVSITGTISLDGKIGAIGNPIEKAKAAENAGATIFCIPKENEYTYVERSKAVAPGFYVTYTVRERTVDLIQQETKLTVYLVDRIEDLLEIATYKEG